MTCIFFNLSEQILINFKSIWVGLYPFSKLSVKYLDIINICTKAFVYS